MATVLEGQFHEAMLDLSEGYTALWERKHLELAVEAVVLQPKWRELFTQAERNIAITRLRDYGFEGPLPAVEAE